ncbi:MULTISPECIES: hypothetical protein [Bacillus cereus group]|uniref:Uncharacterized protein n=1 Tax=Bacillus thuringiensis TaxID=1428 RepID=A0A1C4FGP6_BACTU|nr:MULTISPECIES: hypothetical protein [Bacillus cereus group]MED3026172.1 hypothetical protein [Bacillus wiedmannii]SCC54793.1 Uncharacterized protein BTT61001_04288 [Bacillus thuringiensis]
MIAFHVYDKTGQDADEKQHQIIFAENEKEAILKSDAYGMSGYFEDIVAERQPHFDKFSDTKKVPMSEMVKHGWNFECSICYRFANEGEIVNEELYCDDCIEEAREEQENSTK